MNSTKHFTPKPVTSYRDEERTIIINHSIDSIMEIDRRAPSRFETGVRASCFLGVYPANFTDIVRDVDC